MKATGQNQAWWRQPTGWLAAYALVFQLFVGGLLGAGFTAQAAGAQWSFFEICYGNGADKSEQTPDGLPAKHAVKCVICITGHAGAANLPDEPQGVSAQDSAYLVIAWAALSKSTERFPHLSGLKQRAPPVTA